MEQVIVFLLQQLKVMVEKVGIQLDMDILNAVVTETKIEAIKKLRDKYGFNDAVTQALKVIEEKGGKVVWDRGIPKRVGLKEAKETVELITAIQCFTSNTRILEDLYPKIVEDTYHYGRRCPTCNIDWQVHEITKEIYDGNCDNPSLITVMDEVWGTHTLLIQSECPDCRNT